MTDNCGAISALGLVAMVHTFDDIRLRRLYQWKEALAPITVDCAVIASSARAGEYRSRLIDLCDHVDISLSEDIYVSVPPLSYPSPPYGAKSGPNIQFFRTMALLHSSLKADWALVIENDTYPTNVDVAKAVLTEIESAPDAWVIGAAPHVHLRQYLDKSIWNHINGAALYRTSSTEFQHFLRMVWEPSLLYLLRTNPWFAFDVITDNQIWDLLPQKLAISWWENHDRFVVSKNMLNLSDYVNSVDELRSILERDGWSSLQNDSCWSIHAKFDPH